VLYVLGFLERLLSRARRSLLIVGGLGLTIAVIGAYVAAATLFVPPGGDDTGASGDAIVQQGQAPPSPPEFPASDYHQSSFPAPRRRPLVGANYTHYAFPNCTFRNTYVIAHYHKPGVAEKVHKQLFQMRKAGVATIRTILWHDAKGQPWGPIPSDGGGLREPFRSNLMRFVSEVRRFGFARFTLVFEPKRTHHPLRTAYQPGNFVENWRFIREARTVVKRYGPSDTRFDLLGEGAPNETPTSYEPRPQQTARYLRRMYSLYVRRYGNRDVTVSAIGSLNPATPTNRVQNLVRILRSSGEPLPRWYDVHVGDNPAGAAYALRQAERQLNAERQPQPLVIGDVGHENPGVAQAIKTFVDRSPRRLEEVTPWYTYTLYGCQVPPPYSPGVYGRVLHSP
jgi:hypothetical protein